MLVVSEPAHGKSLHLNIQRNCLGGEVYKDTNTNTVTRNERIGDASCFLIDEIKEKELFTDQTKKMACVE
jgi:hypothetical protein